jgi:hypothetical protein
MAIANSTQHLDLLGKIVHLVDHIRDPQLILDTPHRGQVIAVVVPLPGTVAAPSILLDEGNDRIDYYDLEDITIISVT